MIGLSYGEPPRDERGHGGERPSDDRKWGGRMSGLNSAEPLR